MQQALVIVGAPCGFNSTFWLLAARAAPGLGGTDPAKKSLSWLAVPSAGLLLLGIASVIGLTALELFAPSHTTSG